MKHLLSILAIAAVLSFTACCPNEPEDLQQAEFVFNCTRIDGKEITVCCTIPATAEPYISGYQGTYALRYSSDSICGGRTIKEAIMDFDIASKRIISK